MRIVANEFAEMGSFVVFMRCFVRGRPNIGAPSFIVPCGSLKRRHCLSIAIL